MGKARSHRYSGILATPAKRPLLRKLAQNPNDDELKGRALLEGMLASMERFLALCQDCGVEPDAPDVMTKIAFTLAERHVPGWSMDVGSKRGAPRLAMKKLDRDYRAFQEMGERVDSGQTIRQAAQHLARKMPSLGSAGALDRRYRRIEKDLARDPVLQHGFIFAAELSIAKYVEAMVNARTLGTHEQQLAERLLYVLRSDKSPEDRLALLKKLGGAALAAATNPE